MVPNKMINIEIVYASKNQQKLITMNIEAGCTIQEAIMLSGILLDFPEIDLNKQRIGVFSKQRKLVDFVQDGERIEIYRELIVDPKEARRAKAKKYQNKEK